MVIMKNEKLEGLPENWAEMSHLEKDKWFARHYLVYLREGEITGIAEYAPDDVKKAYKEFLNEKTSED